MSANWTFYFCLNVLFFSKSKLSIISSKIFDPNKGVMLNSCMSYIKFNTYE